MDAVAGRVDHIHAALVYERPHPRRRSRRSCRLARRVLAGAGKRARRSACRRPPAHRAGDYRTSGPNRAAKDISRAFAAEHSFRHASAE